MKTLATLALIGTAIGAAGPRPADETREPPQIFALEVDGKRIPLELDVPLDLETRSPSTRVTLRSEPHRVFDFAGVRFHYPREMGFEADLETPSVAVWTLDGNSAIVVIQRFEGQPDAAALRKEVAEGMTAEYGRGRYSQEPTKAVFGKRELEGTAIRVAIAGSAISQEVYCFPSGKDSIVLVLQDSLKDDGGHTDEYRRVVGMLGATLRYPDGKE